MSGCSLIRQQRGFRAFDPSRSNLNTTAAASGSGHGCNETASPVPRLSGPSQRLCLPPFCGGDNPGGGTRSPVGHCPVPDDGGESASRQVPTIAIIPPRAIRLALASAAKLAASVSACLQNPSTYAMRSWPRPRVSHRPWCGVARPCRWWYSTVQNHSVAPPTVPVVS